VGRSRARPWKEWRGANRIRALGSVGILAAQLLIRGNAAGAGRCARGAGLVLQLWSARCREPSNKPLHPHGPHSLLLAL
jgi:hypothetical protein